MCAKITRHKYFCAPAGKVCRFIMACYLLARALLFFEQAR